ncbi:MAG: ATPase, T2SS/T4P/T4SS family [Verrucomicrobiota bacterium]
MAYLRIDITEPEVSAKEFPLPTDGRVTIGRDATNDVVLPHAAVSRSHAEVICIEGQYQVADAKSRGGTFVGKDRIQEPVTLKHGAEIRIGLARLTFVGCPDSGVDAARAVPARPAQQGFVPAPPSHFPALAAAVPRGAKASDFAVPEELYTDEVIALKRRIHERVLEKLNLREVAAKQTEDGEMRRKLEEALGVVLRDIRHEIPQVLPPELLRQAMLDELIAYGPITPMLKDASVTEIMVNGAGRIFVEQGLLKETRARFVDDRHLMVIIRRIVEPLGRRVDEASPRVDARLPDGSRVNAIIPPIALDGPSLTIRKFPEKKLTTDDLIRFGSLTPPMAKFLEEAVRARQNIVVSGGTGSGKTTLLNVLTQFIPEGQRIVTIEDSAELRLTHRNLVRLEARPPNIEGKGRVTIQDLVINALRMRPDRIVVGECRGAEALDMLQAMNTGHDGSLTTTHANTPRDSLSRLETMVMMAGYDLPSRAIRDQIAAAVDLIVQQTRFADGSRRIEKISEITGREGDVILMQDIFVFEQKGFDGSGKIVGRYRATGNKPRFIEELKLKGDLQLDINVFKADA